MKVQIKAARKLGPKIYLLEMGNAHKKAKIMSNKYKLSRKKEEKVFINNDLTWTDRHVQKQIRMRAQKQRQAGKTEK